MACAPAPNGNETEDPTELISCGKCNTINTVPYGLDKFMCYNCNVLVAISREPSAACAAASTAARHLEEVPGCSIQAAVPAASEQPRRAGEGGASGFLGKLQKTMDKAVQKAVKAIEGFDDPGASDGGIKPVPPRAHVGPPPELTAEEEQLQWALDASLREARTQHSTTAVPNGPSSPSRPAPPQHLLRSALKEVPTAAAAAPDLGSAGDQLQAAAAEAARRLRAVEQHARRAEADLAAAKERETSAASARAALERQLQDNERLIQGLTSELDRLHAQLSEKTTRCTALERALVVARNAAAVAATQAGSQQGMENEVHDLENQGVIAQLLERIAQLESTMLRATHFAPELGDEAVPAAAKTGSAAAEAVPPEQEEEEEKAVPAADKAESAAAEAVPPEQVEEEKAVPAADKAESAAAEAVPPEQVEEEEKAVPAAEAALGTEGAAASMETEEEAATPGKAELREEGSATEVTIKEERAAIDKDESLDKQERESASTKEA